MNFFASSAFLCLITLTAVLASNCGCPPNNSIPACCTSGSGCRVQCPRDSSVINLIYQLISDCEPQVTMLTFPGLKLYPLILSSIKLRPGDNARLYFYDVFAYLFYIGKELYYITAVGDRTEAGCATVRPVTYSDQDHFILYATFSHKTAREIIARTEATNYDSVCNAMQLGDREPQDDPEAFQIIELGNVESCCVAEPLAENNEANSAVKTENARLGLQNYNDVYGNGRDARHFYEYIQMFNANCGTPSSCKTLKYLESLETLIERAGCNTKCINPKNDNAARELASCASEGFGTTNSIAYLTTPCVVTVTFPAGCSKIDFFYFKGSIASNALYDIFSQFFQEF